MFGPEDYETDTVQIQQDIPTADAEEAEVPAQSERYGDFIIKYVQNINGPDEITSDTTFQKINEVFGILYIPLTVAGQMEINSYSYNSIPKCYTYMDLESLNASGITRLHNHPYLQLLGKGTAVAVIDSGIDYTNPLFRDENGSRILILWDQTLVGGPDEPVPYGRVFTKEDIDRALEADEPLEVVPSTDTNGHGTALAAVAAGNFVPGENFSGAAPGASLIIVKLKPAKTYLREFYLFPPDADIFQENDVMMGISYVMRWAYMHKMPLSVCLGIGSSQGAHLGDSPLSQYIDYAAGFSQVSISIAAGNEGSAQHHFVGTLDSPSSSVTAEFRVGSNNEGFTLEFWGEPPEVFYISIQSPTGEILDVSSSLGAGTQTLSFVFVETKVLVNYVAIERQSGNTLVYFRFLHPAPGIWKIVTRGRQSQNVNFHMWMPVQGLISPGTYFLEASPYNTITNPGNSIDSITVTAYQYRDNSLYLNASRGFTPEGIVTPQFAAPGVDIRVPLLNGGFGMASGTSLAAAQTAGVAALLFEWAIIRGNAPFFSGNSVKYYLQRGARREENVQYPNPEWGYGRLDLYHTFEILT
ncbi:MAG: S8 family peptidase [Eubacteriales bacterium]|nr:S8 family peptidase [Eubacteriales bacterium]